ncbi:hypothetical protein MMC11_002533 [Xylographa trunciseda]|nr:hypothetical protein [Xylographa trunciseda]
MANPVTSIINPESKKETLLFTVAGEKRQLAMAIHSLDTEGPVYPYQDNGVSIGNIVVPGSLAAVVRRGLVTVYGFTIAIADVPKPTTVVTDTPPKVTTGDTKAVVTDPPPKGTTGDSKAVVVPADEKNKSTAAVGDDPLKPNIISQLIPFPNPVSSDEDPTTIYVGLAAVSDNNITWIYFIKQTSKGSNPTLREATITPGQTPDFAAFDISVNPLSRVAALYLPTTKERLVFFQHDSGEGVEKNAIQFLKIGKQGVHNIVTIIGTTEALVGTALAATFIEAPDGKYVVYLYYTSGNLELVRTINKDGAWSTPTVVSAQPQLLLSSQMTATHDAEHNHVFYIENSNPKKGYRNHRDPLDKEHGH